MGGSPWLVIQHVAAEGPGLLGGALDAAGAPWSCCRLDRAEALPGVNVLGDLGGLVVLGGPMGVHDTGDHPWLEDERGLLRAAVRAGLPVLGICLGAQQLALALGGEVFSGPAAEIGAGSVTLSAAGEEDPVLGPAGSVIDCVHWHGDTFTLPPGAVLLASSDPYPHQAFRVGPSAYAFQFHVEVDAALATSWAPLLPPGVDLDAAHLGKVAAAGRGILDRFAGVGRRPAVSPPIA